MNENTLVNKPSIQNKNSYNKNKWRKIRQAISTEIRGSNSNFNQHCDIWYKVFKN